MKKLVQDDSCHWYVINEEEEKDFDEWVSLEEKVENGKITEKQYFDAHKRLKDFENCRVDGPHRIYFDSFEER